jgi:hypothetical protein
MARADDLHTLLEELGLAGVEYVLVGGMAAVLHGAPITTLDIDIVHHRTEDNVDRLLGVLDRYGARYRGQPKGRALAPTKAALLGSGHHNLGTDLGPIDVLGALVGDIGYDALAADAETRKEGNLSIRVVSLRGLIEIKTRTNRAKDRLSLPILVALLEQKKI